MVKKALGLSWPSMVYIKQAGRLSIGETPKRHWENPYFDPGGKELIEIE